MPARLPIAVVGLDPVGLAVVHRLHALGLPVQAVASQAELARHGTELAELGIGVLTTSGAWESDLRRLDLAACGAVVLAADDEAANVDACLVVRRYSGDVPLLVRVSDPTLVRFLRMGVPHVDVYSMGSTTAPVAAEMAIQLLGERRARPAPVVRPAGTRRVPTTTALLWLGGTCLLLAALGAWWIAGRQHLSLLDALSTTWAALVTGAEGRLVKAPAAVRWMALAVSLLGRIALVAVVGLVVDWLLRRRFAAVVSSPVAMKGHVVVFGAGNVGARVAELLHKRKVKVVVVENQGQIRNVQRLRSAGVPVVVGDGTVDETLDLAAAWHAGVALALTNSDAVNLHVGLQLGDKKVGVPTVVRLLSPELIAHVGADPTLAPLSPVAETASHVCRTAERMRADRLQNREVTPLPEAVRTTGRFAGPEFDTAPTLAVAGSGEGPAPADATEAQVPPTSDTAVPPPEDDGALPQVHANLR